MENFIRGLSWIHIAAGFAAFVCAPIALLTLKGGPAHRRFGKYYFWLMAVVSFTALIIAVYRPTIFLALVSVFAFYFAFSGYRALFLKRSAPHLMDWTAVGLMIVVGVGLIALGIWPPRGSFLPAPVVTMAFGAIATIVGASDLARFLRPSADKNAWWYSHMAGMIPSYIAAMSAFSAVNLFFLPMAVRWLWPTVIGVPALIIWINHYKRKFNRPEQRASATA